MWIVLLALVFLAYIILMPLWVNSKASQALRELQDLRKRLATQFGPGTGHVLAPTPTPTPTPTPAPTPLQQTPAESRSEPVQPVTPPPAPQPEDPSPEVAPENQVFAKPRMASAWEQSIGANWSVWVGAVALTVGAVMLVKYMVDAGVLSPIVRCTLGALFGALLVGGGEGLNKKGWARPVPGLAVASIPEAVEAAGLAAIYASVNIAANLYDLIGPGVAFTLMAGVSFGAIALSLRHGILLTLVGLAGAYLAPALVHSVHPSALILFGYLAALTATCQALIWRRDWPYLKALQIAAAALWLTIWFSESAPFSVGLSASLALHGFALVLVASAVFGPASPGKIYGLGPLTITWLSVCDALAAVLAAVAVFVQVRLNEYSLSAVSTGIPVLLAMGTVARLQDRLMGLAFLALATVGGLIATWGLSVHSLQFYFDKRTSVASVEDVAWVVGLAMAAFYALGCGAVWGVAKGLQSPVKRPGTWLALASFAPVVMIGAAHARGFVLHAEGPWMGMAGLSALLNAAVAVVLHQQGGLKQRPSQIAAFALGALGALCLMAAIGREEIWLGVMLALSLGGVGILHVYLKIEDLKIVLLGLGGFIILRLFMDPFVLSDLRFGLVDLWWVVPAYGVPSAMFALASRCLWGDAYKGTGTVMDAGSAVFSVMMITAASRLTMGTGIGLRDLAYLEAAVHSASWLGVAYAFYLGDGPKDGVQHTTVSTWAWRFLAGAGLAVAIGAPLWADQVMPYGLQVGATPFFNTLFMAYFVPGGLAILFARTARARGQTTLMAIAGAAALALMFAYVNLSVRHLFHGSDLMSGPTRAAEVYTYSMAWIGFAGVMMTYGMVRELAVMRKMALGLMALSVCKVVLIDMNTLSGLYRALSFLGLGAALIALGFAYQRIAQREDGLSRGNPFAAK